MWPIRLGDSIVSQILSYTWSNKYATITITPLENFVKKNSYATITTTPACNFYTHHETYGTIWCINLIIILYVKLLLTSI